MRLRKLNFSGLLALQQKSDFSKSGLFIGSLFLRAPVHGFNPLHDYQK